MRLPSSSLQPWIGALAAASMAAMAACANVVDFPGVGGGGESSLPANRDGHDDGVGGGATDAGSVDDGSDAGATPAGAGGAGSDAGPVVETCQVWSDCGPFYSDPNSGYACVNSTCVCDPQGSARQNCLAASGTWRADLCYCQTAEPPPIGGACQVWQDCGPHYGDLNSGFECVGNTCTCDPTSEYAATCTNNGGTWIVNECFCAFADEPPPEENAGDNCYWHWEAPPCDPDRWVDTSHYEDECGYDASGEWRCEAVWVVSGYWEDGACPSGHWERRC